MEIAPLARVLRPAFPPFCPGYRTRVEFISNKDRCMKSMATLTRQPESLPCTGGFAQHRAGPDPEIELSEHNAHRWTKTARTASWLQAQRPRLVIFMRNLWAQFVALRPAPRTVHLKV